MKAHRMALGLSFAFAVLLPLAASAVVEAPLVRRATGQVVAIDMAAKAVALTALDPAGSDQRLKVRIDSSTEILKDGESILFGELRRGDTVLVHYRDEAGDLVAIDIAVQAAKIG